MKDWITSGKARSLNIQLFFRSSFERALQQKMLVKAKNRAVGHRGDNAYRPGSTVQEN